MESQNLFGLSEAMWKLMDQWGILLGLTVSIISLIGMGLAIVAYTKRDRIRKWFSRNQFPNIVDKTETNKSWDGILFTVSHAQTPQWIIDTKMPGCITLLATQQSRNAAEKIIAHAQKNSVTVFDPIYLTDPDSPEEAKRECKHLLRRMRDSGAQSIAVDITGGKTPMSLGAFMAAEEESAASIYVSVAYDEQLKSPDMRTATLATISEPI